MSANAISAAVIKFDGAVRGPEETGIDVFVVVDETGDQFWFEASYAFEANGNDFRVVIRNFGLYRKSAAGSTTPTVRHTFSVAEAAAAQTKLRDFFRAPSDNPDLPYAPFRKGRGLGVDFPPDWATVA